MRATFQDNPIIIDPHYGTGFYAEYCNVSVKTIERWFQDRDDVLKVGKESRGKRTRVEIRIPWSVFMKVYREKCKG